MWNFVDKYVRIRSTVASLLPKLKLKQDGDSDGGGQGYKPQNESDAADSEYDDPQEGGDAIVPFRAVRKTVALYY